MKLGVVLLAAGASTRMGTPKLLLPWGPTSILGHLLRQWKALGATQIAVVHAQADTRMAQALDALNFAPAHRIPNPVPQDGMFSSIRCAATWTGWQPGLTHWAIVLGDQPHLRVETLRALLDFAQGHPENICQPARDGHRRHPVILPRSIFMELASTPAENLKLFLRSKSQAQALVEIEDPGLDLDLDTPADYQRALRGNEA